jgi:hypothetical protein
MLPEEKTKFIASAEGYDDAQETLSLPEGETHELTLVLKRSAPPAKEGAGLKEDANARATTPNTQVQD